MTETKAQDGHRLQYGIGGGWRRYPQAPNRTERRAESPLRTPSVDSAVRVFGQVTSNGLSLRKAKISLPLNEKRPGVLYITRKRASHPTIMRCNMIRTSILPYFCTLCCAPQTVKLSEMTGMSNEILSSVSGIDYSRNVPLSSRPHTAKNCICTRTLGATRRYRI